MTTLIDWLTWIVPLATVALTITLWVALMIVQSPKRYWRDPLNVGISGIFVCLAVFIVSELMQHTGAAEDELIPDRALILVAGGFALLALPETWAELRRTRKRLQERERQIEKGGH